MSKNDIMLSFEDYSGQHRWRLKQNSVLETLLVVDHPKQKFFTKLSLFFGPILSPAQNSA
jgi:hypothetical protein